MTTTKQLDLRRADAAAQPRAHPRRGGADAGAVALRDARRHRGGRGRRAVHAAPPLPQSRRPARRPSGPPTGERSRGARRHAASRTPGSRPAGQPRCHPRLRRRATGHFARTAGGRGTAHRPGSGGAVRSRHRRLQSPAHGRTATSRGKARGKAGCRAGARRRRALRSAGATLDLPQCTGIRPVATRPRQRSDDRLRSARRAAQRARTPGGGSDHPGRPLHGCVCPGAAPQAADGSRRDPAKPAPAAHLSDHGWGSCRERAPELRGRGGLVRRDRERRWGLGQPGGRTGRLDPGGSKQRRRNRRPPSQSPQRWRHRRSARRDAPGAPRDAGPARGDDSRS